MKVKAAAERAREEVKRDNPDIDEKKLHVDLPTAPAVPANQAIPAPIQFNGLMAPNPANMAAQAGLHRATIQLVRFQNEELHARIRVQDFEAQVLHMRQTAMHNPYPQFANNYQQREAQMVAALEQERLRFAQAQVNVAEARVQVDAARANVDAAAPPPQPAVQPAFNVNVNVNFGRQAALLFPPPRRNGRRR
jgi:hypothetical protein